MSDRGEARLCVGGPMGGRWDDAPLGQDHLIFLNVAGLDLKKLGRGSKAAMERAMRACEQFTYFRDHIAFRRGSETHRILLWAPAGADALSLFQERVDEEGCGAIFGEVLCHD